MGPIEADLAKVMETLNYTILLQLKVKDLLEIDLPALEERVKKTPVGAKVENLEKSVRERNELIMWAFCQIKDFLESNLSKGCTGNKNAQKLIEAYDRIAAWTNDPLLTDWATRCSALHGENNEQFR